MLVCNQNTMSSAESCNALDDDCDGSTDENNPGGNQACNTGLNGVCANGTTSCSMGTLQCNQTTMASAEVCNGLDDDCDAMTDEGNPGGGAMCSTNLFGVCAAGTTACSGGTLACNQNTMSSAEICDGLDNDCDNFVDDGNPGGNASCNTGLPGICAAGTTQCSGGMLACNQNNMPVAEICGNALDDDCNGVVDNGCCTPLLSDGGFEAGQFGGLWVESSTNFDTPICSTALCGNGGGSGPRTGLYWSWFGGIAAVEIGSMSQTITIPAGNPATLSFWIEIPVCGNGGTDTFAVTIDGANIYDTDNMDATCGVLGYVQHSFDVSAYADGGMHTLLLEGVFNATGTTNFMVDDVSLDSCIP
jgi:hypothetical protein